MRRRYPGVLSLAVLGQVGGDHEYGWYMQER